MDFRLYKLVPEFMTDFRPEVITFYNIFSADLIKNTKLVRYAA